MWKRLNFRDLDWLLLLIAVALGGVGVVEIYSTTMHSALAGESRKQLEWIVLGVALAVAVSQLDYHRVVEHAPLLYLGSLVALGAVLVLGRAVAKTHRWLTIGGQTLQVSELEKLIIIIAVAFRLGRRAAKPLGWSDLAILALLGGVPALLVSLEPDLGTALTYLAIVVAGVLLSGIRRRRVVALMLLGALSLPVGWRLMLPYQRDRLMSFIHPSRDSQGSSYQATQSKIAIGSGGLWGKGFGHGSQSQLGFVPVSHADFIFAAFAEERGFAGTLLVLLLYLALLLRLLDGAQWAPDRTGAFLVTGFPRGHLRTSPAAPGCRRRQVVR
jgi:rod shape determining protein RodA